jgi:DNA (cytosine-5)-methyltransferase 1
MVHQMRARMEKPTFINLFAGAGGLSLGLMAAGWQGLFAVEKDKNAFETQEFNLIKGGQGSRYDWPDWLPVEPHEIGAFIGQYQRRLEGLRGQVDLVAGGPPCQGFSLAGKRREDDPRNAMFEYYVRIVDLIRPKLLLLENVGGIAIGHGKETARTKLCRPPEAFSERIRKALEDVGYQTYDGLLKASDFGVPQIRTRYFVVGVEEEYWTQALADPFELVRSMREEFLRSKGLRVRVPVTARQAICDLETRGRQLMPCEDSRGFQQVRYSKPSRRSKYQELMQQNFNGGMPNSLRLAKHRSETVEHFNQVLRNCRHGVTLSENERKILGTNKHQIVVLDKKKPSHTLTTLPDDLIHYSEPRILTVRESARLQSFPDWYEFKGKYTTGGKRRVRECPRYTQVGNAVPPLLAEALGQTLLSLSHELTKRPHSSLIPAIVDGNCTVWANEMSHGNER